MDVTKICKRCGMILPIEQFRLKKGQVFQNPYYSGMCKSCEADWNREYKSKKREKEYTFSDDLEILSQRKFKTIDKARILDITTLGITPAADDEIFVKLMDYNHAWLSNYGRVISCAYGKYSLLKGSCLNNELRYSLRKNVFCNGKWIYKSAYLYAPKAVVETFIVNEDKANNRFIWHKGNNKQDCYYKNLYPLNQEQFRIVRGHFLNTGNDSEEFIINVMNDIRYKPDNWSKKAMTPVMYGVGYHGILYENSYCESYQRWHYIMNRCYSKAIHELQPEYEECIVCEEWLNYSNFKLWYDEHSIVWKILGEDFEIDKDILIKGNKVYSAETVSLVPKLINSLFTNGRKNRGDYPLGVYFDEERQKFRACMSFMGDRLKLGTFDTEEEAFARYKEYKEDLINDIAEQYKGEIPDKVYQAMINWVVEITD